MRPFTVRSIAVVRVDTQLTNLVDMAEFIIVAAFLAASLAVNLHGRAPFGGDPVGPVDAAIYRADDGRLLARLLLFRPTVANAAR